MDTLDDLDRQLLTLLQANAREATATLARKRDMGTRFCGRSAG